ncbi:hypothetical protein BXZ70DRAFT_946229 [Cristinia sonorae]|uniref:Peroxisome membrane anchor protein Pex14p N-terminal domain-containing protein n=1 Tax=Cristinia sonorae TaxID=1940300 RepID=A0A8K0UKG1_9AGAR|nr:hypothetical protein BXZ70DRAFT_946229 [Cristinia sonorae]
MMSDDSHPEQPQPTIPVASDSQADVPSHKTQVPDAQTAVDSTATTSDRAQLLDRARTFLHSPQVRNEDYAAKYRFLAEKGLNEVEIHGLLNEVPSHTPAIPPRTYPQPPPSNLPGLFIGLARILSWAAGGSLALLFVYFRYIYPRLTQSYQARLSLRNHQKDLLSKLSASLTDLRSAQKETFPVLPIPDSYKEEAKYRDCHSLESIFAASEKVDDIPPLSLLRCAFEELGSHKENVVTSDLLFETLEARNAWIGSEEGTGYAQCLWNCLNNTPLFVKREAEGKEAWTYTPQTPPPPPPSFISLSNLRSSLPQPPSNQPRFQHTMQALSDFTGYIAAQTYGIPTNFRLGMGALLSPEAEDVRREIRALKGLVLNRRSFMPASPRPPSVNDGPPVASVPAT